MSAARRLALVPLLGTVMAAGAGLHLYLARRLVLEVDLPAPVETGLCALLVLLFASLVLAPVAERRLSPALASAFAWPAAVWLGFAFLLVALLALADLLGWLLGAAVGPGGELAWIRARALGVVGVAVGAGAAALRAGLAPPPVRRVPLRLRRWPRALDGYRIVQISDLHIGATRGRRFATLVTERVNALAPDLVAVTGDLADGRVERLAADVEPFGALRARDGVHFVTGNHDFYSGADAWCRRARELGMRVLRNQRVAIGEGDAAFELAGVDDHHGRLVRPGQGEDLERALRGREPGRALVLLAHDPSTFKAACRRGVDLQLSGHTHGGQIWPFHHLVRLAIPFVAGLYERHGSTLYVSRGTGYWGPPMRLLAPAEITELELRAEVATGFAGPRAR